jgi:hypothetical protein
VDLSSFQFADDLSSEEFTALLNDVFNDAINKREKAEVAIDAFAHALETTNGNGHVEEKVDVKKLLVVAMRLRLVEQFCQTLLATAPAYGTYYYVYISVEYSIVSIVSEHLSSILFLT